MVAKSAFIVFALLAGSWALPTPEAEYDPSFFYSRVDPDSRIIGGVGAGPTYNYMVALTSGAVTRSLFCGGTLLTRNTVLTAAHCITAVLSEGSLISSLQGVVGTNRWNSGGVQFTFSRHLNHPDYDAVNIKNDVGLLYTSFALTTSALVGLVILHPYSIDTEVDTIVVGWGRLRTNGPVSASLMELRTRTITGQQCIEDARRASQQLNRPAPPVDPSVEICTFHSAGRGTCNGDSGSPLIYNYNQQRYEQIGVVSWGFPCARGAPDVYAKSSSFYNWVQRNRV